jgi:hypothetical protein
LLALILAALADSVAQAVLQILQTREKIWLSFFGIALPSALALVLAARLLTPLHGALGLAWAYVLSSTLAVVVDGVMVWRIGVWSPPERLLSQAP